MDSGCPCGFARMGAVIVQNIEGSRKKGGIVSRLCAAPARHRGELSVVSGSGRPKSNVHPAPSDFRLRFATTRRVGATSGPRSGAECEAPGSMSGNRADSDYSHDLQCEVFEKFGVYDRKLGVWTGTEPSIHVNSHVEGAWRIAAVYKSSDSFKSFMWTDPRGRRPIERGVVPKERRPINSRMGNASFGD